MKGNVLNDIEQERLRQDTQWGGSDHDDQHSADDWLSFIQKQVTKAVYTYDYYEQRKIMVKIAALAVAAMESYDRQS